MSNIKRLVVMTILTIVALNCSFAGQVFIFGGKNTGPGARVGYAGTADITFRALTANVALRANLASTALLASTADFASLATTASIVSWTGVINAPAFVTAGQIIAVERATSANYTITANTALHVINGAITSASIANGTVGAIQLSPEVLTKNYAGNVSLNAVSLVSLTVAGTVYTAPATVVPHGKQRFTSSGTFVVPAGVTLCYISMCGGGGSGGGCYGDYTYPNGGGGGGGAQAYLYETVSVIPGNSITVTIGKGGAGVAGAPSNGGETTTFGSLLSAAGGGAGMGGYLWINTGGAGGVAGGNGGANGMGANGRNGGSGGGSLFGAGGQCAQSSTGAGMPYSTPNGSGYGAGGAGSFALTNGAGGNGSPGLCLVEW